MATLATEIMSDWPADGARAFEARVEELRPRAHRIALAVLRDPGEAEDVVQEAFLRAYRRRSDLRDVERFDAWLGRIVYHLALNRWRQRSRRQRREATWATPRAVDTDGERIATQRVLAGELLDAVDRLPEKLRVALRLAAVEGLDSVAIGELLDVPPATVRSRIHLARKKLLEVIG